MNQYLDYINDNIKNFTEKEIEIFKKSLFLIDDSLDYCRTKVIEYCIINHYFEILDILIEINPEIDITINIILGKNFDMAIIDKFLKLEIDIDLIIKTAFKNYSQLSESQLIEFIKRKEFYEKDKGYLLSYAAHYGFPNLLEILIKKYKITKKLEMQHALLHAIYNSQKTCILLFIESGIDINSYIGCTSNCIISKSDEQPLCKISCSAYYNRRGIYSLTAAVKRNDIDIVQILLDSGGIFKDCFNDKSNSIINIAISNKNIDMLKLISKYIDISDNFYYQNNRVSYPKNNLLKLQTESPNLTCFNPLISFIISKINNNSYNENDISIVKFLFEKKVCPNQYSTRIYNSAFTLLCDGFVFNQFDDKIYFELLDLFLKNGSDIDKGLFKASCFTISEVVFRKKKL